MRCPSHAVRRTLLVGVLVGSASVARAQVLGPDFAGNYGITVLPSAPGVPVSHGGLAFKDGDPNTLLVAGPARTMGCAIYEVPVTRDAFGHIVGYAGTSSIMATAPMADGGLAYGPGGVLFFSTFPSNQLGQIEPGSTAPDKMVDLTPLGVNPSTGGIAFVPAGFPGAGHLKLTSFTADLFHDSEVVPDGSGTYDVINVSSGVQLIGALESALYVDSTLPAFGARSVLVGEWFTETVGAYEVDAVGDPMPGTRRDFFSCCGFRPSGSTVDPLTGDLVVGDKDGIAVVRVTSGPLGTSYCGPAVPNSTGAPAVQSASGSPVALDDDVTLAATDLPPNQFGYFLNSMTQGFVQNPGGSQGNLCLGGQIGRYNANIFNSGAAGAGSLVLDLANTPTPTGTTSIAAGETWNFTCWYRDNNPGPTSNFTDGLAVLFQ